MKGLYHQIRQAWKKPDPKKRTSAIKKSTKKAIIKAKKTKE